VTPGYGAYLLQTLLVLAVVCVAAWAILRFGLRRLYPASAASAGAIRVVARLPIEPRRTLYIIEAGGKSLLVGVTDGGMTTLAELDPEALAAMTQNLPPRKSFLEVLRGR
jgi:flagellar protein FliO/FliZ